MTCSARLRSPAEILADIEGCEEAIRRAQGIQAYQAQRQILRELVWEQTQALDREERARIEALYPVAD